MDFDTCPLLMAQKKVLEHIKEINPNGEFILMSDGRQLLSNGF